MRHTREHLEKLKFNWLELHTKRAFLLHLSDGDEWRACQTSRWTPGELKQLERELEPAKAALKTEKERTAQLQRTLSEDCETLLTLQEAVRAKHSHATSLTSQYRKEFASLQELRSMLPNQMARSVEELQAQLDEQSISLEKKVTSLDRQRAAVADLERLLTVHEVDNAKLQSNRSELDAKRISLSQRGAGEAALSSLCQWYTNLTESLSNLTGCKVEMVQPSYLLATVISASSIVPVHIYVDAVSGKLQSVKVGSTSATPKRQWKELVEAAIEYNDIPFLLRSIHSAISSK
jgi:chromosome segregation ATPase